MFMNTTMCSVKSFCDLSVRETNIEKLKQMCETYIELGYKVIAVNQIISETEIVTKKKSKRDKNETQSPPRCVDLSELKHLFQGKLKILNRLTISFSDGIAFSSTMNDSWIKEFDLLAAIPETQDALKSACGNLNIDIISFDPENNYPLVLNRKMYNNAVQRGVYFELMYVPAMFGSALRQLIISKGHLYHYVGKSKNIVVSSSASCPFHIKGPYDVINIGLLLGLSEELSKFAITGIPKKIISRAEGRKIGKMVPILIESVKDKAEEYDSECDVLAKKPRCG